MLLLYENDRRSLDQSLKVGAGDLHRDPPPLALQRELDVRLHTGTVQGRVLEPQQALGHGVMHLGWGDHDSTLQSKD